MISLLSVTTFFIIFQTRGNNNQIPLHYIFESRTWNFLCAPNISLRFFLSFLSHDSVCVNPPNGADFVFAQFIIARRSVSRARLQAHLYELKLLVHFTSPFACLTWTPFLKHLRSYFKNYESIIRTRNRKFSKRSGKNIFYVITRIAQWVPFSLIVSKTLNYSQTCRFFLF